MIKNKIRISLNKKKGREEREKKREEKIKTNDIIKYYFFYT